MANENIVGVPFSNWVKKQINKRQEVLGKTQRSPEEIQFLTNKNSWVRIASSVNITEDIADEEIKEQLLLDDKLAKGFVLFGGVASVDQNLNYQSPLGGVTPTEEIRKSFLNSSKYSYGFGSPEYGYTSPPGIDSVQITHQNRGSIRKYIIKLKAQNLDQFKLIDALYLRLGYFILIEWGHTSYFYNDPDNDGTSIFRNSPEFNTKAFTALFEGEKDDIITGLRDDRKNQSGNYDGGLAKVSNFSWTFNSDGSYDITIQAISIGGIIDSLTMNFSGDGQKNNNYPSNLVIKNLTPSEEIEAAAKLGESIPNDSTTDTEFLGIVKDYLSKGKIQPLIDANILADSETTIGGTSLDTLKFDEYADTVFSNQYKTVLNTKLLNDILDLKKAQWVEYNGVRRYKKVGQLLAVKFESGDSKKKDKENYYLTLGNLFAFILEKIIKRNFSQPGSTDEELKESNPILGLSSTKQIFAHPLAGSSDPYTCIVPFKFEPYEGSEKNNNSFLEKILSNNFRETGLEFAGNLEEIYVNMECVAQILEGLGDSMLLFDFLDQLMFRIQIALGNINEFSVVYNEDANYIDIQDETVIPGQVEQKVDEPNPTKIRVYGVDTLTPQGSFLKNVSMISELTPNTAKEMAIGAVATKDNINDSTSLLGNWNLGHVDRLQEKDTKFSSTGKDGDTTQEKLKNIYKKYYDYLISTYETFLAPTMNDISVAIQNAAELYNYDLAIKTKNGEIAGKGFIPINLQISLDGLSGVLLYQKFELTPNILPPSYSEGVEFIITAIDHTIIGNEWTTTYSTIGSPKWRPTPGQQTQPPAVTDAFSTLKTRN